MVVTSRCHRTRCSGSRWFAATGCRRSLSTAGSRRARSAHRTDAWLPCSRVARSDDSAGSGRDPVEEEAVSARRRCGRRRSSLLPTMTRNDPALRAACNDGSELLLKIHEAPDLLYIRHPTLDLLADGARHGCIAKVRRHPLEKLLVLHVASPLVGRLVVASANTHHGLGLDGRREHVDAEVAVLADDAPAPRLAEHLVHGVEDVVVVALLVFDSDDEDGLALDAFAHGLCSGCNRLSRSVSISSCAFFALSFSMSTRASRSCSSRTPCFLQTSQNSAALKCASNAPASTRSTPSAGTESVKAAVPTASTTIALSTQHKPSTQ